VSDGSDRERDLDETIEETFPASDAPSHTGETGTRLGITPPPEAVSDNRDAHRFELTVENETAVLLYQRTPTSLILVHTEVPPAVRGRHLADTLAKAAIAAARAEGLRVVAVCPFVKAYLRKHRSTPDPGLPR
jgi:predicted GNAT family acetyltransferase